jgi:hypothetical protein
MRQLAIQRVADVDYICAKQTAMVINVTMLD